MASVYKRILLKLSGEALGGEEGVFDHGHISRVAGVIKQVKDMGVQVGIVIGAGNIWRGRQGPSAQMDPVTADQMGMLGTAINCLCMQDALTRQGVKAEVFSAVDMHRFTRCYNTAIAMEHMEAGNVLLFACGTGNPFFSTDTAVVLRAIELKADAVLMAKNIDGVYDADPKITLDAKLIRDISYEKAQAMGLKVMDAAAFSLCRENNVPMVRLFGLQEPENILKVLSGESLGTFVHP
jgi:uridylate kinase